VNERVLINGEPADRVSSADRGFQYGDGLFETVAVHAGRPRRFERHLARLARGATRLSLPLPPAELLRAEADRLCAGSDRAVLKIIVTRGRGGRGYACGDSAVPTRALRLLPWPERPASCAREGIDARLCATRLGRNSRLAGIKHLNRLEQVLARAEWGDEYAEGLMRDDTGALIEGTMTNLFLVRSGVLVTPDLSQCGVEGVMRSEALEAAPALGIATRQERVTLDDLAHAEEVFVTNSIIGVWPVRHVDLSAAGRAALALRPGPVARRLQEALADG
jgi:4-amino-4-deoxychorismate lyase